MGGWYTLSTNDKGQFSFALKAGNGEVILRREQYEWRASVENGIASVQKNGAEVEVRYNTAYFTRRPTLQEQNAQLKSAQIRWDDGKKHYETLAAVGEVEHSWYRTAAQSWAEQEGMPFPPAHDPIESIDVMIRDEVGA